MNTLKTILYFIAVVAFILTPGSLLIGLIITFFKYKKEGKLPRIPYLFNTHATPV